MAGLMKSLCMVLIAAVLIAVVAPPCEAAIGCNSVYLNSCIPYLTGKGPLGGCCNGVKGLNSAANTTPDRQSVCNCLKLLVSSYSSIDLVKAAGLPSQCDVTLSYKITPSTDCSKVQ